MKTLQDSISCIAVAVLFWFTLAFLGFFLAGCFSLAGFGHATGLQTFACLFIGSLFGCLGILGMTKIVNELLKV